MRAILLLLILATHLHGAGLGVYNPAQHAVNGFIPTQLPGLQLWLDASRIGYTNGASIPTWYDFSGNQYDATNNTASSQPTLGNISGRNALIFDGTDDWLGLIRGLSMNSNSSQFTICAAAERYGSTSSELIFYQSTANAGLDRAGVYFSSTNKTTIGGRRVDGDSYQDITNAIIDKTAIIAEFDYASARLNTFVNLTTNSRAFQSSGNSSSNNSAGIRVVRRVSGSASQLNGRIGEIICINRALSDAEKKLVHRYLGTKYGIVVQ